MADHQKTIIRQGAHAAEPLLEARSVNPFGYDPPSLWSFENFSPHEQGLHVKSSPMTYHELRQMLSDGILPVVTEILNEHPDLDWALDGGLYNPDGTPLTAARGSLQTMAQCMSLWFPTKATKFCIVIQPHDQGAAVSVLTPPAPARQMIVATPEAVQECIQAGKDAVRTTLIEVIRSAR